MSTAPHSTTAERPARESFSRRSVFILSAIGSAVGLGNIWRFPYIAYENGGGAFLIPYVVALLTAGLPLLLLEYAVGHRYRGSGPLAFRRLHRYGEIVGWLQVGMAFLIALYYPVIIAWAASYAFFSVEQRWGNDPARFFSTTFLHNHSGFGLHIVPHIALAMLLIWLLLIIVTGLGIDRGIGKMNHLLVPLLVVLFGALVVRSLFLPGAVDGLSAFFSPHWSSLGHADVWINAYGQIFFSLNVGFAVMVTYSSYVKRRTDLVGSAHVVAFSNASFEALAGIGVFATLGYLASISGESVNSVVDNGIGLAFTAFPTIISTMPGGSFFGVVFFTCLTIAGFTSEISVVEVCISALSDKYGLTRKKAQAAVIGPLSVGSVLLFSTTTGSHTLDIFDKFVCSFGIVCAASLSMITIAWLFQRLPVLSEHLNSVSRASVGIVWKVCIAVLAPLVLNIMLVEESIAVLHSGYGDYPTWALVCFGWLPLLLVVIISVVFTRLPWPQSTELTEPTEPSLPDDSQDRTSSL